MADQNRLAPSSMNMLRFLMMNNGMRQEPTSAKELLAQQEYYRSVLGDNMPQNSRGSMPFFDSQTSSDPRFSARFSSPMAQFVEGMGYETPPPSVQGRLGVEGDVFGGQLRAGAQTMAVQFPDGTVRMMPRNFDAGYRTPFMGGQLDIGGNITPKEGFMPQTMYGVQARFNKKF
jgi:hypothetical protein